MGAPPRRRLVAGAAVAVLLALVAAALLVAHGARNPAPAPDPLEEAVAAGQGGAGGAGGQAGAGGGGGGGGGDAGEGPAPYDGPRHPLVLRVEDPAGHGLEGAEVVAFPELLHEATRELHGVTDREGHLRFEGLPPGGVELAATLPGFGVGRLTARLPGPEPVVLVLAPEARLTVRVVGERGERLVGVELRLRDGRLELDEQARTDAEGEASFAGLPAGEATLRAEAPGHLAASAEVVLPAGETARLTLRLRAAEQLEGIVEGPDGAPAAGASVAAFAAGGLPQPQERVTTDERGRFVFDRLPPGRYTLVAAGDGPAGETVAEAPARGVRIRLPRPAAVKAALLLADGGEARGAVVDGVEQEPGRLLLEGLAPGDHVLAVSGPGFAPLALPVEELRPGELRDLGVLRLFAGLTLSGTVEGPGGSALQAIVEVRPLGGVVGAGEGPTRPDGSFEIPDLPPGRYRVTARAQGLAPESEELTLYGPPGSSVKLRLGEGAFVRGRVLIAEEVPAPRRTELRAAIPGQPGEVARALTDSAGSFTLGPLAPGEYLLVLELGRRLSTSRIVLGSSDLELTLGPPAAGARLHGQLSIAGGPPLSRAGLVLVPGRATAPTGAGGVLELLERPGALLGEVDAVDGRFRLHDVPAGPRTLVVLFDGRSADEGRAFAVPVEIPAGGELRLDVAVPRELPPFDLSPLR